MLLNESTTTSEPLLSTTPEACNYERPSEHMLEMRFWLVIVVGTTVSLISIIENIFLFFLFAASKKHRRENLYMMLLAFFDIFVSMAYIMLMSVNVLSDIWMSVVVVRIWYSYMIPMITISHIAMTASSFLIVAASFERYCATSLNTQHLTFAQKNRKWIALLAIFLGILSKSTMWIEFELVKNPECEGYMMETILEFRPFVFETSYHTVFRFWYRNFVTVFAPFFILLFLNCKIVKSLNGNSDLSGTYDGQASIDFARRKDAARSATRTLVLVSICYLISNIINVILTVFEHVDKQYLVSNYQDLYFVAIDMVSLLTTTACAFRLPIYLWCQKQLRMEFKKIWEKLFDRRRGNRRRSNIEECSKVTFLHVEKEKEADFVEME